MVKRVLRLPLGMFGVLYFKHMYYKMYEMGYPTVFCVIAVSNLFFYAQSSRTCNCMV